MDIKFGAMAASTRVIGRPTRPMVEAVSYTPTATSMMVIGAMTKHMDLVNTLILMALNTKAIGSTINNTVKEKKNGRMVHNMRDTTKVAKKTVTDSFYGLTNQVTQGSSLRIIFMDLVSTAGPMAVSTTANGLKIKCKVVVSLPGLTVVVTKASTSMTRKKGADVLNGPTVEATTDIGAQVTKKASESTTMPRAKFATAAGKTEKEHNGYRSRNSIKKLKGISKRIRDEQQ